MLHLDHDAALKRVLMERTMKWQISIGYDRNLKYVHRSRLASFISASAEAESEFVRKYGRSLDVIDEVWAVRLKGGEIE